MQPIFSLSYNRFIKEPVWVSYQYEEKKEKIQAAEGAARLCPYCDTTKAPEWRLGPLGRNTLCNRCGLRWKKSKNPEEMKAKKPTGKGKKGSEKSKESPRTYKEPVSHVFRIAIHNLLDKEGNPPL